MSITAPSFLTIRQMVQAGHAKLQDELWDYIAGGSGSEVTLRRNQQALQRYAFRPRVLRDVSQLDPRGSMLGHRLRIPVFLSPIGSLGVFHPEGAKASARAADRFGTMFFYGVHSETPIEEIVTHSSGPLVFQLYLRGGPDWAAEKAALAERLGFKALCVTVDMPVSGRRERDIVNDFEPLAAIRRPNLESAAVDRGYGSLSTRSWKSIEALRQATNLPIIIKGIQTGEDAALAVEAGASVIYVSNHGGRQLDHARAAIDILPEVVAAVAGRCEVVIDGGFTSGADVVKALIVGASAVGIGKLHGLALTVGGQAGVERVLEILEAEILAVLGLLGATSLAELSASYLSRAEPVGEGPGPLEALL